MGLAARSGSLGFLLVQDGLEAGNVLAQGADRVGLFDLAGVLLQAELNEFRTDVGGARSRISLEVMMRLF
jgi:hypothetical protein